MLMERTAGDDVILQLTVITNHNGLKDISGASVEAAAVLGSVKLIPDSDLTDGIHGVLLLTWNNAGFTAGTWDIQVRLTISGDTQTIYRDQLPVVASVL